MASIRSSHPSLGCRWSLHRSAAWGTELPLCENTIKFKLFQPGSERVSPCSANNSRDQVCFWSLVLVHSELKESLKVGQKVLTLGTLGLTLVGTLYEIAAFSK